MSYQSFEKEGSSDSASKYKSMKLDTLHLAGKVVLDIGCNEGFFCHKMVELGAKTCVGIDNSEYFIKKANARLQGTKYPIQFIHADIHHYVFQQQFDIILISSAMHYMNAAVVISKVTRLLKKGGVFVYEGGIIMDSPIAEWVSVKRKSDTVIHPTKKAWEALVIPLFSKVLMIGKSVIQKGDPIERYVYHCYL
jgi:2-polyprenyl-3-methyl-5-hydroxy-6-metoxy-1,4-benzoquinol methylase